MIEKPDEYGNLLNMVTAELKDQASLIEIRGKGAARFVFAVYNDKSLELSQSSEGVWLEFWNDESEEPVREVTVLKYDEAIEQAKAWLR